MKKLTTFKQFIIDRLREKGCKCNRILLRYDAICEYFFCNFCKISVSYEYNKNIDKFKKKYPMNVIDQELIDFCKYKSRSFTEKEKKIKELLNKNGCACENPLIGFRISSMSYRCRLCNVEVLSVSENK